MIQNILQYQKIERGLIKIESEIHSSEERKRAQRAKAFLLESEENVNKIDKRAEELINLVNKSNKTFEENKSVIIEYDNMIKTLKSEDETAYLAKKVNQILDNLKNIEREIASISKDIEDVVKSFVEFRNKYGLARKEYSENKEKYEMIKSAKAEEINGIKAKLETLSKKVDPVVFEKYTKKRNDKIFPVLVPVRDNMCGGCSMQISLKETDKLKTNKIIECENCRRLIYTES